MDWNVVGEVAKNVVVAGLLAGNVVLLAVLFVKRYRATK